MKNERLGRLNKVTHLDGASTRKVAEVREADRPCRLRVEAWALKAARDHGARVPLVHSYSVHPSKGEALVLERIDGNTLTPTVTAVSCEAFRQVGGQLAGLKGVSAAENGYGWLDPQSFKGIFPSWKEFLNDYARRYGGNLVAAGLMSKRDLECLVDEVKGLSLPLFNADLVHRDIKPGNVIVQNGCNSAWIIDWENVMLGDGRYDLALFGVRFGRGKHWDALAEGYGLSDITPEFLLYEKIVLVGIVDFFHLYGMSYARPLKRLLASLN